MMADLDFKNSNLDIFVHYLVVHKILAFLQRYKSPSDNFKSNTLGRS